MSEWLEKVRSEELNRALKEIRAGKNIDVVMDSMSRRLNAKLLHPIIKEVSNTNSSFDIVKSRAEYNKIMRIK